MQTLTDRMGEDMRLRGFAPSSRIAGRSSGWRRISRVRPTHALTEAQLRDYFLDLVTRRRVSRSTLIVYRSGIRFLYEVTLQRKWPVFALVRPAKRHTLPHVLSTDDAPTPRARWSRDAAPTSVHTAPRRLAPVRTSSNPALQTLDPLVTPHGGEPARAANSIDEPPQFSSTEVWRRLRDAKPLIC